MRLQPIVYTTAMTKAVEWYSALLGQEPDYKSDVWTSFSAGDGILALHRVDELPTGSRVDLSLTATDPLEETVEHLAAAGVAPVRGIQDETFGRSIVLEDPEGLRIQLNEHSYS